MGQHARGRLGPNRFVTPRRVRDAARVHSAAFFGLGYLERGAVVRT